MPMPEDLFQDEIEHPEQTWQLQQHSLLAQAHQDSLRRIRTRLSALHSPSLSSPSVEEMPTSPLSSVSNQPLEHRRAGQFLPPRVSPPLQPKKKVLNQWSFVALVALLCVVVLSGVWYGLNYIIGQTSHSILPRVTPTSAPHQKSTPFPSRGLKMTSATTGWAQMSETVSGVNVSTIGRTTDGGKTWHIFDFQGQNAGLMGLFFLNDQAAWVALGSSSDANSQLTLMRTIDGGQHWTTLHLPTATENLTFLDQQHGWAWALGPLANVPTSLALYKTSDGGVTWTRFSTMSTSRSLGDFTPGALPYDDFLNLTFQTTQRGWATLQSSQAPFHVYLYQTQDGGVTWQYQSLSQPASGPIAGIHTTLQGDVQSNAVIAILDMKFFTAQRGILSIVSRKNAQAPYSFYLYETNNGGDSWIPLGTQIETQSLHLEILDPTHVLLTGGQTITVYVLVNDQWQPLHSVQLSGNIGMTSFVSSQLGWMLSEKNESNQGITTLYQTSDGGLSWNVVKQVSIPPPLQQQGG